MLQRACGVIAHGTSARVFAAWRGLVSELTLKRRAFVRKQRALRSAVLLGSQILRRRQRELLLGAFAAWRLRAGVFKRLQRLLAARMTLTLSTAWGVWAAAMDGAREERRRLVVAAAHCAQRAVERAFRAWVAAASAARDAERAKLVLAAQHAFLSGASYAFARWRSYVALQGRRQQALAGALSAVAEQESAALLLRTWRSWRGAVEVLARHAERIELALERAQRQRVTLVFGTWASYARAMRAELQPGSPFLSPRKASHDARIVRHLAAFAGTAQAGDWHRSDGGSVTPARTSDAGSSSSSDEGPPQLRPQRRAIGQSPRVPSLRMRWEQYDDSTSQPSSLRVRGGDSSFRARTPLQLRQL